RPPEQRALGRGGGELAGAMRAPRPGRRHRDPRREVLLLAWALAQAGRDKRVGRHAQATGASASSNPDTSESRSARKDDSMMFPLTPIVVHVRSPLVVSMSTLVTAPVPFRVSSTRTL